MTSQMSEEITFGPFTLLANERLLLRQGVLVELGARAFDILAILAACPNEARRSLNDRSDTTEVRNQLAVIHGARDRRNFLERLKPTNVAISTSGKSIDWDVRMPSGLACIIEEKYPIGRLTATHQAQCLLTNPIAAPTAIHTIADRKIGLHGVSPGCNGISNSKFVA
jgi:hypothetical protein